MLLTNLVTAYSQQKQQELKIGDKLPDLLISGIINQQSDKINVKDLYKQGLLIIDFWGTYCVPCIHEMKFLDSLKAKHPGKFNVLMVTPEHSKVIYKFLAAPRNKDVGSSNLILATGDTLLHQLFPHRSVPHNIWIDKNGTIKAITAGNQVNEKNILNFESGGSKLRTKTDNKTFSVLKPFHLGDSVFTYRSIITPRIAGIGGGGTRKSANGATTYSFRYNASILQMYWAAYSRFNAQIRYNLMEVHTNDSLKFFFPTQVSKTLFNARYSDYDDWAQKNTYCYALTLPKPVPDTVFRDYMFNDLERQFSFLKVKIENREIPCTVVAKDKNDALNKSGAIDEAAKVFFEFRTLRIKNARIGDVLDFLYRTFGAKLIPDPYVVRIDPTEDICFDADLNLPVDDANPGIHPDMVIAQLNQLGFHFRKETRPYPILVIHDLDN